MPSTPRNTHVRKSLLSHAFFWRSNRGSSSNSVRSLVRLFACMYPYRIYELCYASRLARCPNLHILYAYLWDCLLAGLRVSVLCWRLIFDLEVRGLSLQVVLGRIYQRHHGLALPYPKNTVLYSSCADAGSVAREDTKQHCKDTSRGDEWFNLAGGGRVWLRYSKRYLRSKYGKQDYAVHLLLHKSTGEEIMQRENNYIVA